MRRLSLAVLFLVTCAVAAGVVYVIARKPRIPDAGTTPAFSLTVPSPQPAPSSPPASDPASDSAAPPSSGTPDRPATKVTFLGDDYTAGVGAKPRSKSWTALLGKKLDVVVKTVGESGAGYAKRSARGRDYASLLSEVQASAPDIVVVSGGRNDLGDDPTTLHNAAHSLFAQLHQRLPHARLVAIAPWWGDSPHPAQLTAVDDAIRAGVRAAGGSYVRKPDPLGGHPNYMSDDADPDNKGYQAIADTLAPALRAQLPR